MPARNEPTLKIVGDPLAAIDALLNMPKSKTTKRTMASSQAPPTPRERLLAHQAETGKPVEKEEVFKIEVLRPLLFDLGYAAGEIEWAVTIPDVQVGTRRVSPEADVVVSIGGEPLLVIDSKNPKNTLAERDVIQAVSYAKLIGTPPAVYAVATSGVSTVCVNVFTGARSGGIPTRDQLTRDRDKYRQRTFTEVELREARSTLITLMSTGDLQDVIARCKGAIEKNAGIRSDESFREMTKVLLVKMAEEKRTTDDPPQPNRFNREWFDAWVKTNVGRGGTHVKALAELFTDACRRYPQVYDDDRRELRIADDECVRLLVGWIEPFSMLGTGDDIKGQVYEVFLKGTLRGEFDQYFTPREVVDFMVGFADPEIGDVILDPACGSGGFLIQAFNRVCRKIADAYASPKDRQEKFDHLVQKCLWGQETDYDLHVLAKINLIMHGDGWNNVKQGDTLKTDLLPADHFDVVLMNPPFTIPYADPEVLAGYDAAAGKHQQELDILFVNEAIRRLKPGKMLYTVLPEGMVNLSKYREFREWLLGQGDVVMSVSLPEGAFIPFGTSVSKTCVLGVRKKGKGTPPAECFVGRALFVGFKTGKKKYVRIEKNNLGEFLDASQSHFAGVRECEGLGECGWVRASSVTPARFDGGYLLNAMARDDLMTDFEMVVPLSEACEVRNIVARPRAGKGKTYRYFDVPAIGVQTGSLTNVRTKSGGEFGGQMHRVSEGDLLFVRINPRQNRVLVVPEGVGDDVLVSAETHRLVLKEGGPFKSKGALAAVMRTERVVRQASRIGTGGSSSRSRVQPVDLLAEVFVPVPSEAVQSRLAEIETAAGRDLLSASRQFLARREESGKLLGDDFSANDLGRI